MRFAVCGAGVIGCVHAGMVARNGDARLVAIVDPVLARAEALAADFEGAQPAAELADVVADVDAVCVCTPTGLHAAPTLAALAAGKHVLVEKPAETTTERIDELIAAAEASGAVVGVISQHRFDPSAEIVAAEIAAGRFGRVTNGIASTNWWRSQGYYDGGGWRGTWELDGGGALMNQGIHAVDLLIAFLGNPVEVTAFTACLAHERIEVEDVATALVRFESGALGMLHASTASYPGLTVRIEVMGDQGSAVIDGDELRFIHVAERAPAEGDSGYGVTGETNQLAAYAAARPTAPAEGVAGFTDSHDRQLADFLDAVRAGRPPRVTLADNRRAVAVIEAIYASARAGGAPVQVSEPG